MKMIVEQIDVEGLEALLGQQVSLWCANYIYAGKLVGVNDSCVKVKGCKIVYETGSFTDSGWKDAQSLPWNFHYVDRRAIESFGGVK